MKEQTYLTEITTVSDPRGKLSFIESATSKEEGKIPFEVKRFFYVYDVPTDNSRGAHAHKSCWQFLIALKGSVHVITDNGQDKKEWDLSRPNLGLCVSSGVWLTMDRFSPDTVLGVFTSEHYDPLDYIHDYNEFLEFVRQ